MAYILFHLKSWRCQICDIYKVCFPLVLVLKDISLLPELSSPPRFRIQGGYRTPLTFICLNGFTCVTHFACFTFLTCFTLLFGFIRCIGSYHFNWFTFLNALACFIVFFRFTGSIRYNGFTCFIGLYKTYYPSIQNTHKSLQPHIV